MNGARGDAAGPRGRPLGQLSGEADRGTPARRSPSTWRAIDEAGDAAVHRDGDGAAATPTTERTSIAESRQSFGFGPAPGRPAGGARRLSRGVIPATPAERAASGRRRRRRLDRGLRRAGRPGSRSARRRLRARDGALAGGGARRPTVARRAVAELRRSSPPASPDSVACRSTAASPSPAPRRRSPRSTSAWRRTTRERIHGHVLGRAAIAARRERLAPLATRSAMTSAPSSRAGRPSSSAASSCSEAALDRLGLGRGQVSERDILHGIALAAAAVIAPAMLSRSGARMAELVDAAGLNPAA